MSIKPKAAQTRNGRVALPRDRTHAAIPDPRPAEKFDPTPRPFGRAGARPSLSRMLVLGIALTALVSCGTPEKKPEAATQPAPMIGEVSFASPKELRGLLDAAKGQVVVINFWATWCPPCVKEMPELAKFWREFEGRGVTFLSVSSDIQSTKDSHVVPFVKSYEIPFPVRVLYVEGSDDLLEKLPLQVDGKAWDGGLPATFVYAPDGALAWSTLGPVTKELLAEKVKPLMATPKTDAPAPAH